MKCFFVSDLHGKRDRYTMLSEAISKECPDAVFMGGDLLPGGYGRKMDYDEFWNDIFLPFIKESRSKCGNQFEIFVIMGNDDMRIHEESFIKLDAEGLIKYVHGLVVPFHDYFVAGYSYVPPTPFRLKDWERYDVSRFTDVGSVSPEEGQYSIDVEESVIKHATIQEDLEKIIKLSPPSRTIYLFHSPPFKSCLDRADLDGKFVDHAPVDVHVGSIAIQRFIQKEQPLLTLHGHIHESARLTGCWKEMSGKTHSFSAAHDGPELALVEFDIDELASASRKLSKLPGHK